MTRQISGRLTWPFRHSEEYVLATSTACRGWIAEVPESSRRRVQDFAGADADCAHEVKDRAMASIRADDYLANFRTELEVRVMPQRARRTVAALAAPLVY